VRPFYFVGFNKKMWQGMLPTLLLLMAGVIWAGCGGSNTRHASRKDNLKSGTQVEMTGSISVRGSTPATMVILETDDDEIWTMQSSPVTDELALLSGVRVRVEGVVRSPGSEGPILLEPSDYHILTLESGETPVVGWITKVDQDLYLKDKEAMDWRITGDLISILSGFEGSKLWVIGKKQEMDKSIREIRVTGYGVLSKQ
jgi:hypothetical protein